MNSHPLFIQKTIRTDELIPATKITEQTTRIEFRQFFLIARIIVSIVTIGLLGYTMDRVRQSIRQRA
ncbi:MAG: hypothetical protein ACU841_17455 [Gammaproteobacteria bacterium]